MPEPEAVIVPAEYCYMTDRKEEYTVHATREVVCVYMKCISRRNIHVFFVYIRTYIVVHSQPSGLPDRHEGTHAWRHLPKSYVQEA